MKKHFYIFLLVYTFLWSMVPLLRNVMSIDAMEAISWGELLSFGTNKHPPLSGWLIAAAYDGFGHHAFAVYLLGQLFILIGFLYTYKLARYFLSEEKAFCSVMILEACYYYTWMPFVDNFNPNILLLGLWPAVSYYFYKSMKENRMIDWCLLGVFAGFCFLGKYQSVFLFAPMLLYLLIVKREQFKRVGLYVAALIGIIIIIPHVVWLVQNDFFSFAYMLDRTQSETHNLPTIFVKMSHIFYPVKFILGQLMAGAGCIAVYAFLAIKMKNIKYSDGPLEDKLFLLFVGVLPFVFQGVMGLITGSRVPSIWGSTMLGLLGVVLFYFFPIKFEKDTFLYFTKWIYAAMSATLATIIIFLTLQTKSIISYPYQKIMSDLNQIWCVKTDNMPLKYVYGEIGQVFQFNIYNEQHPTVILETFGHTNPWIDYEDVKKSGVLVVGADEEDLIERAKEFTDDINPQKYSYQICNKLSYCNDVEFFYEIVLPN